MLWHDKCFDKGRVQIYYGNSLLPVENDFSFLHHDILYISNHFFSPSYLSASAIGLGIECDISSVLLTGRLLVQIPEKSHFKPLPMPPTPDLLNTTLGLHSALLIIHLNKHICQRK